jgi:protease-4
MDALLPRTFEPPWKAPRIAVLEITGGIGMQVRGPEMVRTIKGLAKDPRVRAVVVEIDSPGGSASASDAIYRALQRLSEKKPTVSFVMSGALSGGYLIACATQKIVALPTALVGSIGVIFTRPVVQELLEKVGVKMVMTHEGHMKAMFQPWREPTKEEQEKVTALTQEYYGWFVDAVSKSRKLPEEVVRGYATGEMYSGRTAKDMGLIDELGDLETALDMAAEMGNTPKKLHYVHPRRPLLDRLLARGASSMAAAMLAEAESRLYPRIDFR